MPFQSQSQSRACFAQKARGKAEGWDCEEWADKTDYEHLPEKASHLRKWGEQLGLDVKTAAFDGYGAGEMDFLNNYFSQQRTAGSGPYDALGGGSGRFAPFANMSPQAPHMPQGIPPGSRMGGGSRAFQRPGDNPADMRLLPPSMHTVGELDAAYAGLPPPRPLAFGAQTAGAARRMVSEPVGAAQGMGGTESVVPSAPLRPSAGGSFGRGLAANLPALSPSHTQPEFAFGGAAPDYERNLQAMVRPAEATSAAPPVGSSAMPATAPGPQSTTSAPRKPSAFPALDQAQAIMDVSRLPMSGMASWLQGMLPGMGPSMPAEQHRSQALAQQQAKATAARRARMQQAAGQMSSLGFGMGPTGAPVPQTPDAARMSGMPFKPTKPAPAGGGLPAGRPAAPMLAGGLGQVPALRMPSFKPLGANSLRMGGSLMGKQGNARDELSWHLLKLGSQIIRSKRPLVMRKAAAKAFGKLARGIRQGQPLLTAVQQAFPGTTPQLRTKLAMDLVRDCFPQEKRGLGLGLVPGGVPTATPVVPAAAATARPALPAARPAKASRPTTPAAPAAAASAS